jgi:sugar/nucleoside kinase (ribokinase family)
VSIDYFTFSNLIIDDIVFPDGRTFMNTLGGAGLHALVGMRVWNDRLGYAAAVGADIDRRHLQTLQQFGVDLQSLVYRDGYKTARAWQVFEPDERRIEIFRTSLDEFERRRVTKEDLPASYYAARGVHIQWGALEDVKELINALRERNPAMKVVLEPTTDHLQETAESYQAILPLVSLFSPDLGEARKITGHDEIEDIFRILFAWGAPLVALRMGERGSIVCLPDGRGWRVPVVPTTLVDVTGAGNSYCGGFLTGLGDGLAPLEAGLRAAVSASFALEQFGLPEWVAPPRAEAEQRLEQLRSRLEPL